MYCATSSSKCSDMQGMYALLEGVDIGHRYMCIYEILDGPFVCLTNRNNK